jgi:FtsH-binding integral membrane protein
MNFYLPLCKRKKMMDNYSTQNQFHFAQTGIERAEFIKKTYKHLAGSVLVFLIIETIFISTGIFNSFWNTILGSSMSWLAIIGIFAIGAWIARTYAFKVDKNQQYLGLGLYILLEAFIFVPLISMAMSMTNGSDILIQAGGVTGALFTGLTAVVMYTGKDFSFLKTALMVGGFVAIGAIIMGAIMGFDLGLAFSFFMVLLASGGILFETSRMFKTYPTEFYVGAALGLFASLMLLLWYVLQIFMNRD